jgi:hypothetical protein
MIDPLVGLQKQGVEPVQHKGTQCQADSYGGEDVADHYSALQMMYVARYARKAKIPTYLAKSPAMIK